MTGVQTCALPIWGVLYTAVTRARELFILVGDPAAVAGMVRSNRQTRRYSGLKARLTEE